MQSLMTFRPNSTVGDMLMYYQNGKTKAKGKYLDQNKDSIWNYFNEEENWFRLNHIRTE